MNTSKLFFYHILMSFMPPTRFFGLKRFLLRWCGAKVGENVRIVSSAKFNISGSLSIGSGTWIGHEVLIIGGEAEVNIGTDCDFAPRVTLVTGTHVVNISGPKAAGQGYSLPISIGDGSWICAGATLLGGTKLGKCCVVAAGAVVKDGFESGVIIGGVPARVVRLLAESGDGRAYEE